MVRKKSLFVNALLALVLLLAACTPAATPTEETKIEEPTAPAVEEPTAVPEEPTEAPEPVTIDVWVYATYATDETAPIYGAAQKFMGLNPDITVNIIPTEYGSSSYRDKYITAAQAGSGPDALMVDIIWSPQLAAADLILPLDQYASEDIKNFYPGPVETVTYDGKIYGLPFATNSLAMYYNKTAFEEAGLPLPKDGWTWEEFTNAAVTLTKGDKYGFGLMAGYGGTFEWFPWLWANGGDVLNEDNTEAVFNNPAGVESAETFLGLITDKKVVPEAAKSWKSWDELAAAFTSGVIAMYEVGPWSLKTVDKMEPKFEWDVAPLPMNKEHGSVVGGSNWVINKNTKNADAAYRWLSFITGEDVFDLMDSYNSLAARSGGDQQIVKDDPRMQVFVDALEYANARTPIPNWTTIDYDCLQPAFLKVLLEGAEVQAAMDEAAVCANTALADE